MLFVVVHHAWDHGRFRTTSQVEKSDSCQNLQTAQYRASYKQGAMLVPDSWYRVNGWRGTGLVQLQSLGQVAANNRLRSNASTEPLQISVMA